MDSLTQIVLGAACGEVALGKKIGNKALLWGAIGGTIPDLDVFIGKLIYDDNIHREAFHRGFMHSILFAILMSILLGFLFYYFNPEKFKIKNNTTFKDWWWLWFLSIFTHPILDSFTAFGTQLFSPFSNYRVTLNNISVVDPLYTIPFLLLIIMVLFFKRNSKIRAFFVWMAIGISSIYMLFTLFNKLYVDDVFEKNLKEQKIPFERFTAAPTILNNILWTGTAETKDAFYVGEYSILDSQPITFVRFEKNHELLKKYENSEEMKILNWFTFGYYNLQEIEKDKKCSFNYLKYGLRNNNGTKVPVFKFDLLIENDTVTMVSYDPSKEFEKEGKGSIWEGIKKELHALWIRIKGN